MAAELVTPIDDVTGMPLSILPPLEPLPRNDPDVANWHHLYHPSTDPRLLSIGGWALRSSRIQLMPRNFHNYGKHNYHTLFTGPPLPDVDDQVTQFKLCVLSCAGYMPDSIIDISGDEPATRPMTSTEKAFMLATPLPRPVSDYDMRQLRAITNGAVKDSVLWRRLNMRNQRQAVLSYSNFRYAYDPIRAFFQEFLLQEEMFDVRPRVVKKFLTTSDENLRMTIGESLIDRAATVATAGIATDYQMLHEAGSLHRLMPPKPQKLVKNKLGNSEKRKRLLPRIEQCLSSIALEYA